MTYSNIKRSIISIHKRIFSNIHLKIFALLMHILYSCANYPSKYEKALELSGENRQELENVIKYFSSNPDDSLKLCAAYFLIENMPGHYTIENDRINKYRKMIDEDTINSYYFKKYADIILSHFIDAGDNACKKEDIKYIKAEFLIRHINASFEILEKYKWLEIIPFDIFLEYILPYRFTDERLDLWRDSLHISPVEMTTGYVNDDFNNSFFDLKFKFNLCESKNGNYKQLNAITGTIPSHDCFGIAYQHLLDCRSLGIPATIHAIPIYANRNGYHYWQLDPPLLYKEANITGSVERKTAKIFRYTFSRNEFIDHPIQDEYIPDIFLDPFIQDVTDLYYYSADIEVNANRITLDYPGHAYLCIFNNLKWTPIAIGKIKNKKAFFKKMGKNIVYLPIYFKHKYDTKFFNYPFILNSKGEIQFIVPNTNIRQTIHMERKNPDFGGAMSYYYKQLIGLTIEATNNNNFNKADTIFILKKSNRLFYIQQNKNPEKAYQWFRLSSTKQISLAELYFFNTKDSLIIGKIDSSFLQIFDKDPLTNIFINNKHPLVINFEKPVQISQLACLPRNDGNGIYPDNIYELLYFDLNGWQSLGVKKATNLFIEFQNVPTNALYWLRNLTTGVEERIFTYNNNQIKFW
jgi:hypothetical protein